MGRGYVVEHCVSLFLDKQKEEAFRVYVTDTLKAINESIAKRLGGTVWKERYIDWVTPKKVSDKTGDEIALDIIKRAGLKVKQDE